MTQQRSSAPLRALSFMASAIVAAAMAALFWSLFSCGEDFVWMQWSCRDLVRAHGLLEHWQFSGAEVSFGGGMRVPGGAYYCLLALPFLFTSSPAAHYAFMVGLYLLSAILLFDLLRRGGRGPFAALCGCAVLMASPFSSACMSCLWNPGFMPLLAVGVYYFCLRAALEKKAEFVKWGAACMAVGAQMHASLLMLFPAALMALFMAAKPSNRVRTLTMAALFFTLPYLPYIVYEALHDFPNTSLGLGQAYLAPQGFSHRFAAALGLLAASLKGFAQDSHGSFVAYPFTGGAVCWTLYAAATAFRRRIGLKPLSDAQKTALFVLAAALPFVAFLSFAPLYQPFDMRRESRYLFGMVPALGIACAAALAQTEQRLRPAAAGVCLRLLAAVCLSLPLMAEIKGSRPSFRLRPIMQTARRMLPEHAENLSGRILTNHNISAYLLYAALISGSPALGSQDNGDGLIIIPTEEPRPDPAALAATLLPPDTDFAGIEILETRNENDCLFIRYKRPGHRLFSSLYTRYLPTPEEELTRFRCPFIKPGTAVGAGRPGKSGSWLGNIDDRIFFLIDIDTDDDGRLRAVLHSNQLRGKASNGGFFVNMSLDRPGLLATDTHSGRRANFFFANEAVGANEIITPLAADISSLAPGRTYELNLVAESAAQIVAGGRPGPGRPVNIRLGRIRTD